MKKVLIIGFLAIIVGAVLGKIMFDQYEKEIVEVLKETEVIYIFQQGVYSTVDNVEKNTNNLENYIIVEDEDYYRVYVGATKKKENINKIREAFVKAGNDIYVRELNTDNQSFLEILGQYDTLLASANEEKQVFQISKQVINMYEEMVVRNE